jgi:ribonuclease Z
LPEEKGRSLTGPEEVPAKISAAHLDHFIPSLAFALEERFHINVHKERLSERGLSIGPWLKEMKDALWRGESGDLCLKVPLESGAGVEEKEFSLEDLRETVTLTPGQKIVYVADCRFTEENSPGSSSWLRERTCFSARQVSWIDRDRAEERAPHRPPADLARRAE